MITTAAIIFTLLICFGVPIATLLFCLVKNKAFLVPFFAGVLTFLVSQVFTRIPLLAFLQSTMSVRLFSVAYPLVFGLLVCLSAGVFEETGRLIAMTLMKKHRGTPQSIVFGLGHGGIEALLLVGINILVVAFGVITPMPSDFLLFISGLERIFAICAHVCLSVLVMRAVTLKKLRWYIFAVLLHTALNAGSLLPLNTIFIELYIAVFAILLVLFTYFTHKKVPISNNPPTQEALPYD